MEGVEMQKWLLLSKHEETATVNQPEEAEEEEEERVRTHSRAAHNYWFVRRHLLCQHSSRQPGAGFLRTGRNRVRFRETSLEFSSEFSWTDFKFKSFTGTDRDLWPPCSQRSPTFRRPERAKPSGSRLTTLWFSPDSELQVSEEWGTAANREYHRKPPQHANIRRCYCY